MSRPADLPGITLVPKVFDSSRFSRLGSLFLSLPVWLQAVAVYFVSRVVSLSIFSAVLKRQDPANWSSSPVTTTLNDFLNFWDGSWYSRVAEEGYPTVLPVDDTGTVTENQWAFYPLHPSVVGTLSDLTGISYETISPIVSTIAAGLASIVILSLFRKYVSPDQALMGLALVMFFPPAAIFSTGYAESLTLLLQAMALFLVVERRYLTAIPVVVLMDMARPIGVAFSFFMLLHLIDRFVSRRHDAYPASEAARSWTLGVLSCAAALIHPVHAWLATGSLTAYTDTEAAWHTGETTFVVQWVAQAVNLIGPLGPVLLIIVIAGMLALIFSPAGAHMGRTMQLFCLGYGAYLLIFFNPQTSTLRLLLPLFPMALTLALVRSRGYRAAMLVAYILLQIIWVAYLWHFTPPADLPP
jgi:Gpi18-like mannosyltransferase